MNRSIERAEFLPKTKQVRLSWKDAFTDIEFQEATYDYAMIAAPFSKVRSWRFPNTGEPCVARGLDSFSSLATVFDPTLTNAITAMPYTTVCKASLSIVGWQYLSVLTSRRSHSNSKLGSGNIIRSPSLAVVPRPPISLGLGKSATPAIT